MQDINHQLFTESVEEELRLSSNDFEDISIKKLLKKLLKKLNLHMHYKFHSMSLSGGQKQRVAIACAVASGRDYLQAGWITGTC
jgi:energy-coupling factor transport system ATP-binding protein